jgi:hypothetical protein
MSFSWCKKREEEFTCYFSKTESLVFCSDIPGLITKLGVTYNAAESKIFTDASKRSLKAVLLLNGNRYASVPVKALDKQGHCFGYICTKFPNISCVKLKAGVFDCRNIRAHRPMKDSVLLKQ